jgi:uncharacterized protein
MTGVLHQSLFIPGPAGRLEASLWTTAAADPPLAALVCHPHPVFGGTLHNKVVFHTAKALHACGLPVLRFNFRGAGLSEGVHDNGRGERDDVWAALDYLAGKFPGRPILLAGFSFGAWVGFRAGCDDPRVSELIALGIPVNSVDMGFLRARRKPKLFIHGENDQFGQAEKVEALFATLSEPKRLVIVKGADHFFTGHLNEVRAAIEAWFRERHPRSRASAGPESH